NDFQFFIGTRVGDDNRRYNGIPGFCNLIDVEFHEQIASFDYVPLADMGFEAFTVQLYSVHPDMDEDFSAIITGYTYRMLCSEQGGHSTVHRCIHAAFIRPDGNTLSHRFRREYFIFYRC